MADAEAAAVPPPAENSAQKPRESPKEDDAHVNGDSQSHGPSEEKGVEKPESAPDGSSRQNESKRVKEARQYNNRDKNRHHGEKGDRPWKNKNYYTKNNKFDPSSLPESSDPVLIRKQVEFYFSDSNLHGDKFLFTHIEGSANNPVPIDVIHKFKRMQRFQPRSAIVSALKESNTLNLVNDENDIQRKVPLPEGLVGKPIHEIKEVHENKAMAQSIYAKGFGDEEATSQFDIEAFFAQYGTTNSVRLRRDDRSVFKGSVFVEFDAEEQAKSFVALDPPPKYKDRELLIKTKKAYCDAKVEDIKAGKVRPHSPGRRGRGGFGNKKREHQDDRDWRERRDDDAKDGFKDRRGRGGRFRGSDRGRRGDRGHGRGRDSNDRRRNTRRDSSSHGSDTGQKSATDEKNPGLPGSDDVSAEVGNEPKAGKPIANGAAQSEAPKPTGSSPVGEPAASNATESSKKRYREGDDILGEEPPAKKVDDKTAES